MNAVQISHVHCPICGSKLPPGIPPERCPACLLRLAFKLEESDSPDASDDEGETALLEGAEGELPTAPGVFEDYELIEQIGRGAMGVVFKARQISLDRLVALKVLDLSDRLPADAAKRFRVEASAAAGLRHPCIVAIHEVGVHHGLHYLAMDLVEGATLATVVTQRPLAADRAARLLASVADAIQCAHERGILHRDLKPSNILVDASDQPHVADFGLAKRMGVDADMTIPGQIMGSPNYMSPEQARGGVLGPASDVHALGAVLYHCLVGRPPFFGQTIPDTLHHVIHGEPVSLRLLVVGMPRDLDTIALKCLAKDPAKRYSDARALADELRRFLRREPIHARPVSRLEQFWRWSRRRPAIAGLTAATTLLVLAVAIGSPVAALRIRAERERAEENLYAADMNLVQQALARSSRGQARGLLERHRPTPGEFDRRGFEWRYLWTQCESDEREILQVPPARDYRGGERNIVPIPHTTLVAASNTIWGVNSPARPVFTLPSDSVAMTYDPDSKALLSGSTKGLVSWSIATWEPRELLVGEIVVVVVLSADGRWMATGGEQLRLWTRDAGSWRQVASRPRAFKRGQNAQTLAFSPDGSSLVSGTGESWGNRCILEFWSVPALEPQPGLPAPNDILSLAFSPDGSRLVTGSWSGRIRVWDLKTMSERESAMRHNGFVVELTFSPHDPDVFATAASDRTVRLWSLSAGKELVSLQGPLGHLWALSFANTDNTLLTLEKDGRVAAWDAATRRREGLLIKRGPGTMPLGFSVDGGTLATIDETGALCFWDVERRREREGMKQTLDLTGVFTRDFEIIAPVITRDLRTLAIGMMDGRVQLWDLPTRTLRTLNAHANNVRNLAFSPDGGTLATVADDGILKLWEVSTRTLRAETGIPGQLAPADWNVPLDWSPDGQTLALANSTAIMLYDGVNGRLMRTLDQGGLIFSMRYAPDGGVLVAAHEDFNLMFWNPASGALIDRVPSSHQDSAYDICFSPDGRTLATVIDRVKLWSRPTRQEVSTLEGHERSIFAALFSPDGNLL
ncbi:MAG: serine/threonine-protein kinase, partial [Opitutus sp.]